MFQDRYLGLSRWTVPMLLCCTDQMEELLKVLAPPKRRQPQKITLQLIAGVTVP